MNISKGTCLIAIGLALTFIATLGSGVVEGQQLMEPVWSAPDNVVDLAMSGDGDIVVISNGTHVKVFNGEGTLLWQWGYTRYFFVSAVATSSDGRFVAAAYSNPAGFFVGFWSNADSLSGEPDPTWESVNLGGGIGINALAISGDGNHLVAVGTGPTVYYWNNTQSLSGTSVDYTWWFDSAVERLEYVDISVDGEMVVTGGYDSSNQVLRLYYFNGCTSASGGHMPALVIEQVGFNELKGLDLAQSPGGTYFAAGMNNRTQGFGSVFLFHVEQDFTYTYWESRFDSAFVADVVVSDNGNNVAAALNTVVDTFDGAPDAVVIYHNATGLLGAPAVASGTPTPLYTRPSSGPVPDAVFMEASRYTSSPFKDTSIDLAGSVVAAGTGDYLFVIDAQTGELLGYYTNPQSPAANLVAVSRDGQIIASGGGALDSLHYFVLQRPLVGARLKLPTIDGSDAGQAKPTAVMTLAVTLSIMLLLARRSRASKHRSH